MPTLLAFPASGLLVHSILGSINDAVEAVVGGVLVGLLTGSAQFFSLRKFGVTSLWIAGSAFAASLGAFIVIQVWGTGTSTTSLTRNGLVVGLLVGFLQAASQRLNGINIAGWTIASAVSWGVAWLITANVIVDRDEGYAIFGSSGALVATVILGVTAIPILVNRASQEI